MSPKSKRKKASSRTDDAPNAPQSKEPQQNPSRPNVDDQLPRQVQGRRPAPPAAEQWREHEHQAPVADLQAKQLLQETGSAELAKHAVDQAQSQTETPVAMPSVGDRDAAAKPFGYDSFEALVNDAFAFPVDRGPGLMVCELKDGRWIRFDRESWPKHEIFRSREEAMKPVASG